jgi:hypothetical protein
VPIDHANAGTAPRSAEESPSTESHGRSIHGQSRFTYRCGCPKMNFALSRPEANDIAAYIQSLAR